MRTLNKNDQITCSSEKYFLRVNKSTCDEHCLFEFSIPIIKSIALVKLT